ncbi:MAG: hypothetical protein ACFFAK_17520 [Promethearchaeota archaeon]
MTEKEEGKELNSKSELIIVKEKFYEEENISPEVQKVLDEVFNDMIVNEPHRFEFEENCQQTSDNNESLQNKEDIDLIKEKEKFYSEVNLSSEVKKILDSVFNEMISPEANQSITVSNDQKTNKIIKVAEPLIKATKGKADEKSKQSLLKIEEIIQKELELEKAIAKYQELISNFEQKTKATEESKLMFENRLKELEETKLEFEERGMKLEQARNSFMQLSTKVEERKLELEQREKNVSQIQRELEGSRIKFEQEKKTWDKIQRKNRKMQAKNAETVLEQIETDIIDYSEPVYTTDATQLTSEIVQMERGKVEILKDILQQLSYQGNFQSCFLIDGQGMIISEYSKTEMDALAIGAMFSLVCTTVLRTVRSLSLNELEYFKLSSLNGEFIIRNIDILNYERNFILLAYYNDLDSDLPSNSGFKLNKKQIKRIIKSIKTDFYDLRKSTKISWVFDNIIEKVDFLKQKYNHVDGDINLIRLNLMNKASIKIRELFER